MKTMSDEARAARNEYLKSWRRKNSEKMREYRSRYWERKAQGVKQGGESNAANENNQRSREARSGD